MAPEPGAEIDAAVVSPHKFIGGPGASGVLIVRRDAVVAAKPSWPGGGTVKFVSATQHALLRLAKQAGIKVEGGVEIDFPISRQDVAEMTGTTLHTVSRILSAWEQQGLVEGGRQRIVLRDPHKLFGLAEGRDKDD